MQIQQASNEVRPYRYIHRQSAVKNTHLNLRLFQHLHRNIEI